MHDFFLISKKNQHSPSPTKKKNNSKKLLLEVPTIRSLLALLTWNQGYKTKTNGLLNTGYQWRQPGQHHLRRYTIDVQRKCLYFHLLRCANITNIIKDFTAEDIGKIPKYKSSTVNNTYSDYKRKIMNYRVMLLKVSCCK